MTVLACTFFRKCEYLSFEMTYGIDNINPECYNVNNQDSMYMCVSHKRKKRELQLPFSSFWAYLSDFKLSSHLLTRSPTKRAITVMMKDSMYFMYVSPPSLRKKPTRDIIIHLSSNVNLRSESFSDLFLYLLMQRSCFYKKSFIIFYIVAYDILS